MKEISEFKVGDHWWSRGGYLMRIIPKDNKSTNNRITFSGKIICRKSGQPTFRSIIYFDSKGRAGLHEFSLIKKETDKRKILKAYLGIKDAKI